MLYIAHVIPVLPITQIPPAFPPYCMSKANVKHDSFTCHGVGRGYKWLMHKTLRHYDKFVCGHVDDRPSMVGGLIRAIRVPKLRMTTVTP